MTQGLSSNVDGSFKRLPKPSNSEVTHFEVNIAEASADTLVIDLIDRYIVTDIGETHEGLKSISLVFPDHELSKATPGRPDLRHVYPPRFFEEHILTGKTEMPPDPIDYQLVVHPVHAYCLEASHVAGIIKEHFPQIQDPIIRHLVAALLVTTTEPPSLDVFSSCFRSPPQWVTQDAIRDAYEEVQSNRPSSMYVLRNSLATFRSTRKRSAREINQMENDPIINPEDDRGDRFHLDNVLERGLTIHVKREALRSLLRKPEMEEPNVCPNAEKLKLEKLFRVEVHDRPLNSESKVALGAHDAFDHMFFFELIGKTGLADAFLPRIGNFKFSTVDNIFSVPAEYIAMVAYDWRAWMECGLHHDRPVGPIVAAARSTLRVALERHLIPGDFKNTIERFLELPEEDPRVQQVGFVLRGIQWENGEMAIKWGSVDLRPHETIQDSHTEPWGPTPILQHPYYLAFVVCGLATLNDPRHDARDVLQKIHYTLEHALSEAIKHYENSEDPYTFELKLGNLRSEASPTVSAPIRNWFAEHVGFATIREPLCA